MDSYHTSSKQEFGQALPGAPTSTLVTKEKTVTVEKKPDFQPDLFSPKATLPGAKYGQADNAPIPHTAPPAAEFVAADFKPLAGPASTFPATATAATNVDTLVSTAPAVPAANAALGGDFATAPLTAVPSLEEVLKRTGGADSRPASLMAVQHDQALPLPASGGSGARSPLFSTATHRATEFDSHLGYKPAPETTVTTTKTVTREEQLKPHIAGGGGAGSAIGAKAAEAKEAASEAASTIKAKAADAVDRITEGRPVSEVATDVANKVAGTGPYAGTAGVDTDTMHKMGAVVRASVEVLQSGLANIASEVQANIPLMRAKAEETVAYAKETAPIVASNVKGAVADATATVKEAIPAVQSAAIAAKDRVVELGTAAGEKARAAGETISATAATVKAKAVEVGTAAGEQARAAGDKIAATAVAAKDKAAEVGTAIGDKAKATGEAIGAKATAAKESVVATAGAAKEKAVVAADAAKEKAAEVGTAIGAKATAAKESVVATAGAAKEKAVVAADAAKEKAAEVGTAIGAKATAAKESVVATAGAAKEKAVVAADAAKDKAAATGAAIGDKATAAKGYVAGKVAAVEDKAAAKPAFTNVTASGVPATATTTTTTTVKEVDTYYPIAPVASPHSRKSPIAKAEGGILGRAEPLPAALPATTRTAVFTSTPALAALTATLPGDVPAAAAPYKPVFGTSLSSGTGVASLQPALAVGGAGGPGATKASKPLDTAAPSTAYTAAPGSLLLPAAGTANATSHARVL